MTSCCTALDLGEITPLLSSDLSYGERLSRYTSLSLSPEASTAFTWTPSVLVTNDARCAAPI